MGVYRPDQRVQGLFGYQRQHSQPNIADPLARTRFHVGPGTSVLPSNGIPHIGTVTYSGSWNNIGSNNVVNRRMTPQQLLASSNAITQLLSGGSGTETLLQVVLISDPLVAGQNIDCKVYAQAFCLANNTLTLATDRSLVKLISKDGQTIRSILLAFGGNGSQTVFDGGTGVPENRSLLIGNSLGPITTQEGDRLMIELGVSATKGSSRNIQMQAVGSGLQEAAAVDEIQNISVPGNRSMWVELTQELFFSRLSFVYPKARPQKAMVRR